MPEHRSRSRGTAGPHMKTVHDAVHGSLDIGGVFLELLDSTEFQRLHGVHQLGLASLVFPGANHTRLEHSLGVWHIGTRMAEETGTADGKDEIAAACLLHDIGHPPYSHTLECIFHDVFGIGHEEMSQRIITGESNIVQEDEYLHDRIPIPEILKAAGLDPRDVAGFVAGEPGIRPERILERFTNKKINKDKKRAHLGQLLNGAFDADQLDYLLRDAHHTGVAYGVIDLSRIVRTVAFKDGRLVVLKSGLVALESVIVARALMYSSVYFHRTARIAEMMLARAVERINNLKELNLHKMVDSELIQHLTGAGGFQKDIALRLKYRRLFKKAYSISAIGLPDERKEKLSELKESRYRREVEEDIARHAKVPEGYVIVDLPSSEDYFSKSSMKKADIMIFDEESAKIQPLSKHSPLARALDLRVVPEWALMVSTDGKLRSEVSRAAKLLLP